MSLRPPKQPSVHAVLTSDIVNEAEAMFRSMCPKEGPFLISQVDCITLLRSMGVNPTDADLNILWDHMKIRDPERERKEREERDEWLRQEAERKAKEKAERELMKDDKKAKAAASDKKKKKDEGKDPMLWIPFERRPVIDWHMFIENVEPYFTDSKIEEDAVVRALKVFDKDGSNSMSREELVKILTTKGEDILSPLEVNALLEAFPQPAVAFTEFAKKLQGTWVEPAKTEDDSKLPKKPGSAGGAPSSARAQSVSGSSASGTAAAPTGTTPASTAAAAGAPPATPAAAAAAAPAASPAATPAAAPPTS